LSNPGFATDKVWSITTGMRALPMRGPYAEYLERVSSAD
jgi:hypothetical protein